MIRVYGFYSCGGYKDMYLGSSEHCDRPSYYLPLHPVIVERQSPEDLPNIEQQEKLEQIRLVTRENKMDFPDECDAMFSHGGYVAMYRILSDESTCLAMQDIPSTEEDEVGEKIPFNLLLTADVKEDIVKLDQMAVSVKEHYEEWRKFATSLFVYDPTVNGLKFDLPALFGRLAELPDSGDTGIVHDRNTVEFLMLAGAKNIRTALSEQNLQQSAVRHIVDVQGQKIPVPVQEESDESGSEWQKLVQIVQKLVQIVQIVQKSVQIVQKSVQKSVQKLEKKTTVNSQPLKEGTERMQANPGCLRKQDD